MKMTTLKNKNDVIKLSPMALRLYNELSHSIEEFAPSAAPNCSLFITDPLDQHLSIFLDLISRTLQYLGYQVQLSTAFKNEVDIAIGFNTPHCPSLFWIRPFAKDALLPIEKTATINENIFRFCLLQKHYRDPSVFSLMAIQNAQHHLQNLRLTVKSLLLQGTSTPNAQALASYKQKLRGALRQDFNFPSALSILKDALRPGALSPGSQLSFAKEYQELFGLHWSL